MRLAWSLLSALVLAGCFAPPFPDAPAMGVGHGGHGGVVPPAGHDAHAVEAAAQGIAIERVCFDVRGPPGDAAQRIGAAVYHDGTLEDAPAAIVLIPGGGEVMHVWDGDTPALGVDNASTLPRQLARAGFAAFVYDRLGMGESPYEGDGRRITPALTKQHAGEIVAQVRAGAYTMGADCAGEGAPVSRVALGGHSYGAVIAHVRAADADDIDGLLLLNYVPGGGNPPFLAMVAQCISRQVALDPMADEVYPFCPGEDGWSQELCWTTTWPPGSSDEIRHEYCRNDELHKEPLGSVGDFGYSVGASMVPRPIGDIPVHIVTTDHDCTLNRGDDCGDTSGVDQGLATYAVACGCRLTTDRFTNMGHNHVTHFDQWMVGAAVTTWMEESFG